MSKTFVLGYMPTRRVFFSQEDSLKYKKLILAKIKKLVPDIEIIDLNFLNAEGLLVDDYVMGFDGVRFNFLSG